MIQCTIANDTNDLESVSGVVTPNETLEQELDIAFTSSLSTVGKGNVIMISALNITDHDITIQLRTEVGIFSVLTPEQAEKLIQIDPQLIALARLKNPDATIAEINQLIEDETRRGKSQPSRPPPEYHKLWFPTPETCEEPETFTPQQRQIYDEILKFQQMDRIDAINNPTDKETFSSKFQWHDSVLQAEQREFLQSIDSMLATTQN